MTIIEQQLGQARENSTNAVSVFSPAAAGQTIIKAFMVANTSNQEAKVTIYLDDDGTTYDESTTVIPETVIPAKGFLQAVEVYFAMNNPNGNFAYKSSVANALTITVFGPVIIPT